jgi:hypothetical protein
MCKCRARGFTACIVCCGLLFASVGAKNPPASAVGHVLTASVAGSTVSIGNGLLLSPLPDTVTGAVHRLPTELPRPAMHDPSGYRYS